MRLLALGLLLGALVATSRASAASDDPTLFREGVEALERGASHEAIGHFELLADRGFVHPDASYNRAISYIQRARSSQAESGDWGRAAAALQEALLLRPGDRHAEGLLEDIQKIVARNRAEQDAQPMLAKPSLGRAIIALLPEDVWAILALFGSFISTLGLSIRLWFEKRGYRVAANLMMAVGGAMLLTFGGLTAGARHFRKTRTPAVVVVEQARLLDERGVPRTASEGDVILAEGARVDVVETQRTLARIEWGTAEGWVARSQLRFLARL